MDTQENIPRSSRKSPFFEDGRTMRPLVKETVPYGKLVQDPSFRDGKNEAGEFVKSLLTSKKLAGISLMLNTSNVVKNDTKSTVLLVTAKLVMVLAWWLNVVSLALLIFFLLIT